MFKDCQQIVYEPFGACFFLHWLSGCHDSSQNIYLKKKKRATLSLAVIYLNVCAVVIPCVTQVSNFTIFRHKSDCEVLLIDKT